MASEAMVGIIPANIEEKIRRFQESVEAVCDYEGRGKGWQDALLTRTGASFALSQAIHDALLAAEAAAPPVVIDDAMVDRALEAIHRETGLAATDDQIMSRVLRAALSPVSQEEK